MPEMTPERMKRGCLSTLTFLGGIAGGLYVGNQQALGNDMSQYVRGVFLAAPTGLSAILGYRNGEDLGSDPQAMRELSEFQLGKKNSMIRSVADPEKLAEYNSAHAPGMSAFGQGITTAVATAIGYGITRYLL